MKQYIKINDTELKFSNSREGFDISITNEENYISLHLELSGKLSEFVSAVADFSWSNGLIEVEDRELWEMKESLREALERVDEELTRRSLQK